MTSGRSAILTYHSLDDSGSVISMPPALFRRQMEFLAASGIPVVPLDEVRQRRGSVAITFDDGFRNFADEAVPVLERHRLPATVFVVSRYCGLTNNWPGQSTVRIPQLPLLGWSDLKGLPAGVSVGAHTATHADLTKISAGECAREMGECQDEIEQRLGRRARWLAYPYGASSPRVRSLAGERFELVAGTSLGFLASAADPLNLPRIDAYYLRGWFSLGGLFSRPGSLYVSFRGLLRSCRRILSPQ